MTENKETVQCSAWWRMRSLGWMEKRRKASQSRRAEEERWGRSAVGRGSEGTTGVEEEEKER